MIKTLSRLTRILSFKSPWDDQNGDVFNKKRQSPFKEFNFDNMNFGFPFNRKTLQLFLAIIVGVWLLSGLYQVKEGEEAIVLRFGAVARKATPGLNYRLPTPIESTLIEKVNQSRRIEIGYRSSGKKGESTKQVPAESMMLTGDENIVELTIDIMWHIKDLSNYFLSVYNPEDTIKAVGESALREVIGQKKIASILSNQKQEIVNDIEKLAQKILDEYNIGVQIEQVQLLKAEPPAEVIEAYRDVQTARADKEKEINQAYAYRNDVLPKARGAAEKMIQEAESYKKETVSYAEGNIKRFRSVLAEYFHNKQGVKDRIYLDTMEIVLKSNGKIITNQGLLPHMSLQQPKKEGK